MGRRPGERGRAINERWDRLLHQSRCAAPYFRNLQVTQRWRDSNEVISAYLRGEVMAVPRFIRERLARDLYGRRDG